MEIKDNKLIISMPLGMEIDPENTDEKKGVIMFRKKKDITYEEIVKLGFCVNSEIGIKAQAIAQLINIAKYYNGDWEPDWNNRNEDKCFIYYRYTRDEYAVDADLTDVANIIYFKNDADAQAVIDNPNFRPILDAIYKD